MVQQYDANNRPERFRLILERVMEKDSAYFASHPSATSYERPFVPGEAWPLDQDRKDLDRVRVVKINAGTRSRIFFNKKGERL